MTTACLLVAAGRGTRYGGTVPKIYAALGGRTVLFHALKPCLTLVGAAAVQVVIHPADHDLYTKATTGLDLPPPIFGGATRQDSVRLGLEALAERGIERVLIHDAARPLTPRQVMATVAQHTAHNLGIAPALAVTDSLRYGTLADSTPHPRDKLWRIQTPQGFMLRDILTAHQQATTHHTDDLSLAASAGLTIHLVTGDPRGLKITVPDDLTLAESLIPMRHLTTQGYDIHAFTSGDGVWLGGIKIPTTVAVQAHSDGDVLLHALCDALYGAIGSGDLGTHFPPSDPQWRGAASSIFLQQALRLAQAQGLRLHHVDITIIAARPKIAPARNAIINNLATLLNLPPSHIGLKATTAENLDALGRGEGIAATVTVSASLPDGD